MSIAFGNQATTGNRVIPGCTAGNGTGLGNTKALKSTCFDVVVDVNGFKGPNVFGIDTFYFYVSKYGVVPFGVKEVNGWTYDFPYFCSTKTKNSTSIGYSCTAWVLYNKNMDYLHCEDLSWNGSHYCK